VSNFNKNPLAWAGIIVVIGFIALNNGWFDAFVVLVLAVIISKLVEVIQKLEKGGK
jgi:hypothetical protein